MRVQIRLRQYESGTLTVRFYNKYHTFLEAYDTYIIRRGSPSEVRLQYILNKEFAQTNQYYNINVESNVAYQLYYRLKILTWQTKQNRIGCY